MKLFAFVLSMLLSAQAFALNVTVQATQRAERDAIVRQCVYNFKQYVSDVYVDTVSVFKNIHAPTTTVFLNNLTYRDDTVCPQGYTRSGGYATLTIKKPDGTVGFTTPDITWSGYPTLLSATVETQIPSCGNASLQITTICEYP